MIALSQTEEFAEWIGNLRDGKAQAAIAKRLVRLQSGLSGDVKSVGAGVMEARIHFGPGYRLYFVQRGTELIILLCGGDKQSQSRDIERAKDLARKVEP
jgi:putative addiction module killer protein